MNSVDELTPERRIITLERRIRELEGELTRATKRVEKIESGIREVISKCTQDQRG